jgi:glycerol-3-phosphate dehydrogenase (NAD(P)+)
VKQTITVIGVGSWGTALAEVQARLGHKVLVWDRDDDILADITKTRQNRRFHPGYHLSRNIAVVHDPRAAVERSKLVILAVPSFSIRDQFERILPHLKPDTIVVSTAKGIEADTLETPYDVAVGMMGKREAARRYAVLSGPRRVGIKLAEGKSLRVALKEVKQVVEGIRTAKAAYRLSKLLKADAPILEETYLTLHEGKSLEHAIRDVLARAPEKERRG